MSWEAVTALATVLTVLIVIAQQIAKLNRNHVARAERETRERIAMDHRVGALEQGLQQMGGQLSAHIKHTGDAIEALRNEMPNAIMNGVTRGFAKSLEEQRRILEEQQTAKPKRTAKPRTKKVTS